MKTVVIRSMPFKRMILMSMMLGCFTYASAQKIMGTQGLMNIPTADMYPHKTFVGGVDYIASGLTNYDFPVYNYFIDFTPFPFVELTYRSTLLKLKEELPSDSYCEQDRSFTVRLRPLKEKDGTCLPSVVIGSNDFFSYMGHSYFSAVYGVVTKHFHVNGCGTFGLSAGYFEKIAKGVVYDGAFGGVEYSPECCKDFRVMVEYDTKGMNCGFEMNLLRHFNLLVYTREFNKVCGGVSYQYTIKY